MKIIKNDLLNAVKTCNTVKNDVSTTLWDYLLFQCINGVVTITGRNATKIIHYRLKDETGSTTEPFLFKGVPMAKLLKACPDDLVTITNNDCRITDQIERLSYKGTGKALRCGHTAAPKED